MCWSFHNKMSGTHPTTKMRDNPWLAVHDTYSVHSRLLSTSRGCVFCSQPDYVSHHHEWPISIIIKHMPCHISVNKTSQHLSEYITNRKQYNTTYSTRTLNFTHACISVLTHLIYDYTLITNLMHWQLFIRKILLSSTCFEHQVLIFRRT